MSSQQHGEQRPQSGITGSRVLSPASRGAVWYPGITGSSVVSRHHRVYCRSVLSPHLLRKLRNCSGTFCTFLKTGIKTFLHFLHFLIKPAILPPVNDVQDFIHGCWKTRGQFGTSRINDGFTHLMTVRRPWVGVSSTLRMVDIDFSSSLEGL